MIQHTKNREEELIHETNEAFLACSGSMNTDYAEFAGMALPQFRRELRDPSLTRRQLVSMLRRGMAKSDTNNKARWSALMARQLKKACNSNYAGNV